MVLGANTRGGTRDTKMQHHLPTEIYYKAAHMYIQSKPAMTKLCNNETFSCPWWTPIGSMHIASLDNKFSVNWNPATTSTDHMFPHTLYGFNMVSTLQNALKCICFALKLREVTPHCACMGATTFVYKISQTLSLPPCCLFSLIFL